jgi:putative aldouronate transport system permease protein
MITRKSVSIKNESGYMVIRRLKLLLRMLWKYKPLYLMLLPGLIYFAVYRYAPLFGAIIAFQDYQVMKGIWESPWADPWYKHFQYFYDSPYFWEIIRNTFLISFYKLVWGMPPDIIIAILLNEIRSMVFKRLVQTLSYMPHFLSWVIIYGILIAFFSETSGLVNFWLKEWTETSVPFLISLEWFRSILVASTVWKDIGWGAIIYLAAISGLDPALYEASRIDGAGRMRQIWHITLPGITNIIILLLVLKLGHIMDAGFDQIYIMYNVNVYPVADIIDTWVFRVGLEQLNFSLASAVGLFKSLIGLVLVVSANKIAKKWESEVW